jgi:hypothetical protein
MRKIVTMGAITGAALALAVSASAQAPAPKEYDGWPVCSAKVTDRCIQKGAVARDKAAPKKATKAG